MNSVGEETRAEWEARRAEEMTPEDAKTILDGWKRPVKNHEPENRPEPGNHPEPEQDEDDAAIRRIIAWWTPRIEPLLEFAAPVINPQLAEWYPPGCGVESYTAVVFDALTEGALTGLISMSLKRIRDAVKILENLAETFPFKLFDRFEPDRVPNKEKVLDVVEWFVHNDEDSRQNVLLLFGDSGAGKTLSATIGFYIRLLVMGISARRYEGRDFSARHVNAEELRYAYRDDGFDPKRFWQCLDVTVEDEDAYYSADVLLDDLGLSQTNESALRALFALFDETANNPRDCPLVVITTQCRNWNELTASLTIERPADADRVGRLTDAVIRRLRDSCTIISF